MAKIIRPIPSYEGLYGVSADGQVFNLSTGRALKSSPDSKRGYQRVWLYKDGARKEMYVHRAVALAWVEGDTSLTVNHKDSDNQNNCATNLEWVSGADNTRHSFQSGTRKTGSKKGKTYAIEPTLLKELQEKVKAGRSIRSVAEEYGVNRATLQYQLKHNGVNFETN